MSEECNHDCSSCGSDCAERTHSKEDFIEKANQYSHIGKIYGIVSGKGGVGKSIVASMLAVLTKRKGFKTAILDSDITGPSIPRSFGLHTVAEGNDMGIYPVTTASGIEVMSLNLLTENETDPVVWRGPIIAGTVKQFWTDVVWGDVDYMYIDMPPGTGDVPLTIFQSIPLDGIIIVATPQELVGMIVEKAVNMAKMMDIPVLGLVENMSYLKCPDCGRVIEVFGESRLEATAARLGITNTARLPIDPELAHDCDAGVIERFEGDWLDKLADALTSLQG